MSYAVIIRGPLGSGKSTISQLLARHVHGLCFPLDDVLAEHKLDVVPADGEGIPAENFIRANEIVLPQAREALSQGRPVIFDACFYHRKPIEHLQKSLNMPCHIFTLKVPLDVCIARDQARSKTHGRDAATAVHMMVSRFDLGTIVDGSRTIEETLAQILSKLPG